MKSYRKELWFNIPSRRGFRNITPDVEVALGVLKFPTGHFMIPIHIAGLKPVGSVCLDNFARIHRVVFFSLR